MESADQQCHVQTSLLLAEALQLRDEGAIRTFLADRISLHPINGFAYHNGGHAMPFYLVGCSDSRVEAAPGRKLDLKTQPAIYVSFGHIPGLASSLAHHCCGMSMQQQAVGVAPGNT